MYTKRSVRQFISELSSSAPYPGGGSAACLVGTIAISLAMMVGGILQKKKVKPSSPSRLRAIRLCLKELSHFRRRALSSVDGDVETYKRVVRAYALKKGSHDRRYKIESALRRGYLFQKNFALLLVNVRKRLAVLGRMAEGSIASDLILSQHFLRASFLGVCQTAKINLEYMKDQNFKRKESKVLTSLTRRWR